ncbi:hypothetical protein [Paenarthrobacter nitroguajacolicus]|uniref:hypothetical protein n=1 Tax=Paenarthrobacter nitroguajacolicus TaxID=211146 RepID=UPI0015B8F97C|nr:hypothetical protein [Paenarthrobacter nitroguajacolicus]NWL32957.1 hypothetical protein [Paenarthrobacter nitroguajacolicus]
MSRPLELTIHPPVPAYPPSVPSGGNAFTRAVQQMQASLDWQVERMAEAALCRRKRLSEPELAAEFWHAAQVATYARGRIDWGLPGYGAIDPDRAEDIEHVLSRFAELPHYDEEKQ